MTTRMLAPFGATAAALAAASLLACSSTRPPLPPVPSAALPTLRVEQRAPADTSISLERRGPDGSRITVTAVNADVRQLVPMLAQAAGVNVALGPDVQGRVSVSYQDVPAAEALRATLEAAGLALLMPLRSPSARTVFYNVPVNIDTADVRLIQAAFGVSLETARFIVAARRGAPLGP